MSSASVRQRFSALRLGASTEWMESCVAWHVSSSLYSPSSIAAKCEQQWLDTDLQGENVQSPRALATLDDLRLDVLHQVLKADSLALMVLSSPLDVGTSSFSQLQKLQMRDTSNAQVSADADAQRLYLAAWEPKPKRLVRLTLTNGRRRVDAIDLDGAISNKELRPGCKLVVKAPLKVRRGHLLLTTSNTKVLGGQVDALMPTHYEIKALQSTLQKRTQGGSNSNGTASNLPTQKFKPTGRAINYRRKPQTGPRGQKQSLQRSRDSLGSSLNVSNETEVKQCSGDTLKEDDEDDAMLAALVDGSDAFLSPFDEDDAFLAEVDWSVSEEGDCFNDSNDQLFSQIDLSSVQEQAKRRRPNQ